MKKDASKNKSLEVIIETPKGSSNKYIWDEKKQVFRLKKSLPLGSTFPFDFGFIPRTKGGDGDPIDVLVLMDVPAYPGINVRARLVAGLEAEQKGKEGAVKRNDRLVAVEETSSLYENIAELKDISENMQREIEEFFVSYNKMEGKEFIPLKWVDVKQAGKLVKKGKK